MPSSSHPSHITSNIPYSLAYRLLRIESTPALFESHLSQLGDELLQRGYNAKSISESFTKIRKLSRLSTLQKVVKVPSERINLVIPFDKRLPNISHILHHRWQCLVQRDPLVKEYLPSPPRVAYSRTKSLRDVLVRSKVPLVVTGRAGDKPALVLRNVVVEWTALCALTPTTPIVTPATPLGSPMTSPPVCPA